MSDDRDVVWLKREVKTPPFGPAARREAGLLLRRHARLAADAEHRATVS